MTLSDSIHDNAVNLLYDVVQHTDHIYFKEELLETITGMFMFMASVEGTKEDDDRDKDFWRLYTINLYFEEIAKKKNRFAYDY